MKNVSKKIAILGILIGSGCNAPDTASVASSTSSQSGVSTSSTTSTQSASNSQSVSVKTYTNFAYVTANGYIDQYSIDPDNGQMVYLQPNSLSIGNQGNTLSGCAMKFDPAYKFIFVSNCSGNTLAVFSRNATTGALSYITGDPLTNEISTHIANTRNRRIGVDGTYVYLEIYLNSNAGTYADYLYRLNYDANGVLSNGTTLVANTPGNNLVAAYESSNGLQMTQTLQSSFGIYTYKINQSTMLVDQYDNGLLSAYSAHVTGGTAYVILTH